MANSCSNCFFWTTPPADSGLASDGSVRTCNFFPPQPQAKAGDWPWPVVRSDYWCGSGSDINTGIAFSIGIGSLVGPTGPAGPPGTSGSHWSSGSVDPTGGSAGDWYLRQSGAAFSIWENVVGVWTVRGSWTSA